MPNYNLYIIANNKKQTPAVLEGIQLEYNRKGEPSKLTFTCIKDRLAGEVGFDPDGLSFSEGSIVVLEYDGKRVFFGYVFEKKRDKQQHIEVTCYDRTRYFKNKENYVFTNVTLDQVVTRIAQDLGIPIGYVTKCKHVIPKLAKQDSTVFDILNHAIDLTTIATKTRYTLYDEGGSLNLKSEDEMQLDMLVDVDTFENFDYSTTIGDRMYNQIIVKGEKDSKPYVMNDKESQMKFGIFQKEISCPEGSNPAELAKMAMECHNQVARSLSISAHFGDIRVRAGSGIYINHGMLGDMKDQVQKMWVDKITHTFDKDYHHMDMTLTDGRGFYNE